MTALMLLMLAAAVPAAGLEEFRLSTAEVGTPGGRLVVAQRAEPKTLNPVTALDAPSREVIRLLSADLISINRTTQKTEPSLAKSWTVSLDGRLYTLKLRQGIRFSDGHPFTADDVVFSFEVYLTEKEHSPQRDLLMIGGKPLQVTKIDTYTVSFALEAPYGAGERLFDSIAILPRHLLDKPFRDGNLKSTWTLATAPGQIAGLGPFRLKEYRPGERVTLERNPYYWEKDLRGTRLPYLDQVDFLFAGSEDAQVTRFLAGDADVIPRLSARNVSALNSSAVRDAGPSLEWTALVFNQTTADAAKNDDAATRPEWFKDESFRRAVSLAIDREAIVRLVYNGRAVPLWGNVTPGNERWRNTAIPHPGRSTTEARRILRSAGFSWDKAGMLHDRAGRVVAFSIASSTGNAERAQIATLIQDDLKSIGIQAEAVTLEFRSLVDRVLNTHQYDAVILSLGGGDADPNSEMNVWLSSGGMHIWNPSETQPATPWEAEVNGLMKQQLVTVAYARRKAIYDRVQSLVAEHLPVIFLASPHVLVAARPSLGNFRPAVLDPYALWNIAELYQRRSY